ncbi:hypothetical protein K9M50_02220 [Patescibacteria group bacterium]|nr:hypothetical protein [Patescibacteria group bacterium]
MSKNKTKTILISLVVILLIVVGVYALTNQNNNEANLSNEINNEEGVLTNINPDISLEEQEVVTDYLENNISALSPEDAQLGGTFYVTNIYFPEKNVVIVDYEDGHIALTAQANYTLDDDEVEITNFDLIEDTNTNDLNEQEELSVEDQEVVTTYLENNISALSPEDAVLGGTFYVTNTTYPETNVVIVDYEDGHIALTAQANYTFDDGEVKITNFDLIEDTNTNDLNEQEELSVEDQEVVTTYLENNISALSPEDAQLGGSFYITEVTYPERNIAIVDYEDGHQALSARANYEFNDGEVEVGAFDLIPDGSTVERNNTSDDEICVDMCGDGICQEMVCMGEGCPCAETAETCPADCS